MSRPAVLLLVLLLLIVGALFLLSSQADEVPTKTVEVEVGRGGNAQ